MSYEQFPKKTCHSRYGSSTIPGDGQGTRYPGKSLPTTTDDTGTVKLMGQSGNGASPPSDTFPKRKWQDKHNNLSGLPS